AAPDEEQLDTRLAALADQPYDVDVDLGRGDDLLPLADGVERLDAIPQGRGALELEVAGRGLHLAGQLHRQVVVVPFEEAVDLAHRGRVALTRLPAGARGVASVDVVLQARPRQLAIDLDPARPQREQLAHEPQRLAHGGRRVERSEVRGAVLAHAPGHLE